MVAEGMKKEQPLKQDPDLLNTLWLVSNGVFDVDVQVMIYQKLRSGLTYTLVPWIGSDNGSSVLKTDSSQ